MEFEKKLINFFNFSWEKQPRQNVEFHMPCKSLFTYHAFLEKESRRPNVYIYDFHFLALLLNHSPHKHVQESTQLLGSFMCESIWF